MRTQIATVPPANPFSSSDHREYLLQWFEQRFAVLDRDFDAIIATHLRDGSSAAWYEDVAQAFEEIEEFDLAIFWTHRALLFDRGYRAQTAANNWWTLLESHKPEELPFAARLIFDRWPNAYAGTRLIERAGQDNLPHVTATLASNPDELITFQLETLDDPALAWASATASDRVSAWVWEKLADAYFAVDPVASLEVQLRLIAATLTEANTRKYRPAAFELKKLRKVAKKASPQALALVDQAILELRKTYKRRPSFLAALDRAKLP